MKTCFLPFSSWECSESFDGTESMVSYEYQGFYKETKETVSLPRTLWIEKICLSWMEQLSKEWSQTSEGKMLGLLLVENTNQEKFFLKAFSGLLEGSFEHEGWVPSLSGREKLEWDEQNTLHLLEKSKQRLLELAQEPLFRQYQEVFQRFDREKALLQSHYKKNKMKRDDRRKQPNLSESEKKALDIESQQDQMQFKSWKKQQKEEMAPLQKEVESLEREVEEIRKQRKRLSRELQQKMHLHFALTNFEGEQQSLEDIFKEKGIPSGTGECCAPKLLHYAALHGVKPLALAEFWWDPLHQSPHKKHKQFYGACEERCQPMMGYLLSGLRPKEVVSSSLELSVVWEDDFLVVVNKPSGLLSVPGRRSQHQDSVLSRLNARQDGSYYPVHRLDQDTSGLLLVAKNKEVQALLFQLFRVQQVSKKYEALLDGRVTPSKGVIEAPLAKHPTLRLVQEVNAKTGKPSVTHYEVLAEEEGHTRILFVPQTGRTHQLRVHAATCLQAPIHGDTLYNPRAQGRLALHARELFLKHPVTQEALQLFATCPF